MAALHLEDGPLAWYQRAVGSLERPLNWWEFVYGLEALYENSPTVDYFGELTKLKQEGYAYDQYQNEFMRPSHEVRVLPNEHLISYFVNGLRETVTLELMSKAM